MILRGRWRGTMPFRTTKALRLSVCQPFGLRTVPVTEPLDKQGRGGEPSPSLTNWQGLRAYLDTWQEFTARGHRKGRNSYTERVREAFTQWLKDNHLNASDPLTFQYRLTRRTTITVTLTNANILHLREWGNGSRGFVLWGWVLSIDGVPPDRRNQFPYFALNKIVGQQALRALPEGVRHV